MRLQIDAFIRNISTHRAARTVSSYSTVLTAFADFPPAQLRIGASALDVEEFLARPTKEGKRRAPATRNQELAALRAFAKFATKHLGWTVDFTEGIPFLREPPHDPAVLTALEVRRMFLTAAQFQDPIRRSLALASLALLSQVGLRVHELVTLDLGQVDLASATLISVRGKGGTIHDLPLNAPAVALLSAWLADRVRIAEHGEHALFVSSRGSRLSVRAVQRLLEQLRYAIGTAKHVTPHTLRHTTATLALTMGSDLSTVADLLRHADMNTTRRYLHLVDERRREAVRKLGSCVPQEILPAAPAILPAPAVVVTVPPNPAPTAPNVLCDVPRPIPAPKPRLSGRSSVPAKSTEAEIISLDAQYRLGDIAPRIPGDLGHAAPASPDTAAVGLSRSARGIWCIPFLSEVTLDRGWISARIEPPRTEGTPRVATSAFEVFLRARAAEVRAVTTGAATGMKGDGAGMPRLE